MVDCARSRDAQITATPPAENMAVHALPSGGSSKSQRCSVMVLAEPPAEGAVYLGTIHLAGRVSKEADVIMAVDRKACEMNANAVFVRQIQQRSTAGEIDYEITAAAYAISGAVAPPGAAERPPAKP